MVAKPTNRNIMRTVEELEAENARLTFENEAYKRGIDAMVTMFHGAIKRRGPHVKMTVTNALDLIREITDYIDGK
jgi:hypothetical protein